MLFSLSTIRNNIYWPYIKIVFTIFLLKAFYSFLYRFAIIIPIAVHDFFTHLATFVSSKFLSLYYEDVTYVAQEPETGEGYLLLSNGNPLISIGPGCNALDPLLVGVVFLAVWPMQKKRKLVGIASLAIGVLALNVARVLALIEIFWKHNELFPAFHKVIFQIVLYAFIFFIWWYFLPSIHTKSQLLTQ